MKFASKFATGLGLAAAIGLGGAAFAATNSTPTNSAPMQPSTSAQAPATNGTMNNGAASNGSSMDQAQMNPSNMSQQKVKSIQEALKNDGQNVNTDGVWGPQTETALKNFQQQSGLPATGQPDQATLSKLNVQG